MARFLVDENLSWRLTEALSADGHEASDAASVGLGSRPDEEVFSYARQHRLILVTRDQGFGNPRRYPAGIDHAGVLFVRFPKEWPNTQVISHLIAAVRRLSLDQLANAVVVIEAARIRVRKGTRP